MNESINQSINQSITETTNQSMNEDRERRESARLAKREAWRARHRLDRMLAEAMSKEDLLESAMDRWRKLKSRVTRSMSDWDDLPGTLQFEYVVYFFVWHNFRFSFIYPNHFSKFNHWLVI